MATREVRRRSKFANDEQHGLVSEKEFFLRAAALADVKMYHRDFSCGCALGGLLAGGEQLRGHQHLDEFLCQVVTIKENEEEWLQ